MVSTSFSCTDEEYFKIVEFKNDMNYSKISEAIRGLIKKGLAHDQQFKEEQ